MNRRPESFTAISSALLALVVALLACKSESGGGEASGGACKKEGAVKVGNECLSQPHALIAHDKLEALQAHCQKHFEGKCEYVGISKLTDVRVANYRIANGNEKITVQFVVRKEGATTPSDLGTQFERVDTCFDRTNNVHHELLVFVSPETAADDLDVSAKLRQVRLSFCLSKPFGG